MLLFSVIWKAFKGLRAVGVFRTRVSIVSGTESLMSLQRIKPSRHSSKSCMVSVGIGKRVLTSGSLSMTYRLCEEVDKSDMRRGAYAVDVVRKLLSLILVDGVADVGI